MHDAETGSFMIGDFEERWRYASWRIEGLQEHGLASSESTCVCEATLTASTPLIATSAAYQPGHESKRERSAEEDFVVLVYHHLCIGDTLEGLQSASIINMMP